MIFECLSESAGRVARESNSGDPMPDSLPSHALLTRRRFLATAASSLSISAVGGIAKPYLSRAADRPVISHGIQSGDVSTDSGMVWARSDRPSRMLVEVAITDSFNVIRSAVCVDALPESDFTAKMLVENLPSSQDIFYRVRFRDLARWTLSRYGFATNQRMISFLNNILKVKTFEELRTPLAITATVTANRAAKGSTARTRTRRPTPSYARSVKSRRMKSR